jgi:hypothetical protein
MLNLSFCGERVAKVSTYAAQIEHVQPSGLADQSPQANDVQFSAWGPISRDMLDLKRSYNSKK